MRNGAARKRGAKTVASGKAVSGKAVAKTQRNKTRRTKTPRKRAPTKPWVGKASPAMPPDMVQQALAAFAHEVRTPLTGILAVSELLAASDLGEQEQRWVDTIKASADHLSALATLFVDAARAGGAGLALRNDLFDLRALASMAADSLAGRAAAKGLTSAAEVPPDLPGLVSGDSVRLRAALENLIDNAVKFTDTGSVELTIRSRTRAGDRIAVSFAVSDSGIGLSMAEIRRLFRPFSQANVRIAARFGGTGLGLSSVKAIARAMGGDVKVAPRAGRGVTFTLEVVLDPATAVAVDADGTDRGALALAGRRLRVLSVEDNPFGRVVLKAILTELGHEVDFVGRGEDALPRVAEGRYDAVLMDIVLPDISGVDVIRRLRAEAAPVGCIPIVGVSGRGEDEAAARSAGADAFLLKPVSPRALAMALVAVSRSPGAAI